MKEDLVVNRVKSNDKFSENLKKHILTFEQNIKKYKHLQMPGLLKKQD